MNSLQARTKVLNILKDATPKKPKDPHKPFYIAVITSLIGTTIPYLTLSFCFAVFFFISTTMLINSFRNHGAKASRKFLATFLVVLTLSTISGCGPILADADQTMMNLCKEVGDCKTGTSFGYNIAGISIKKATIEEAIEAGEITKRVATEIGKGYGLISTTKIVVYGS